VKILVFTHLGTPKPSLFLSQYLCVFFVFLAFVDTQLFHGPNSPLVFGCASTSSPAVEWNISSPQSFFPTIGTSLFIVFRAWFKCPLSLLRAVEFAPPFPFFFGGIASHFPLDPPFSFASGSFPLFRVLAQTPLICFSCPFNRRLAAGSGPPPVRDL